MRAIMGESGGKIEPARAMPGPRWPNVGRVVGDDELTCGVNGVGGKIEGLAMDTMPCRSGRVLGKGTESVKGELGKWNKSMPTVRGEGNMHGGKGGDEMVFRRAN